MEDMNFTDHEPRWQAFEEAHAGNLPDSSLGRPPLNYNFRTVSDSPSTAAEYKLTPCESVAEECKLTPVSLDGDVGISFSDLVSLSWPTPYPPDFELLSPSPEPSPQDDTKGMKKERRRAQNRKAQKAFRERKDKAIQRLEQEVEKLHQVNHSLSTANEVRLREIAELRAALEERTTSLPASPAGKAYVEGWDGFGGERGSVSSDNTSTSAAAAAEAAVPTEPADVCGPFIKWQGKVYVDAESLFKRPSRKYG